MKIKGFFIKAVDEKGDEYLLPVSIEEVKDIIKKIEKSKAKAA